MPDPGRAVVGLFGGCVSPRVRPRFYLQPWQYALPGGGRVSGVLEIVLWTISAVNGRSPGRAWRWRAGVHIDRLSHFFDAATGLRIAARYSSDIANSRHPPAARQ